MARSVVLATSAAVHSLAFALVVLLPVMSPEPLPERATPPPMPDLWPVRLRVVLADSRPARVPAREANSRPRPALVLKAPRATEAPFSEPDDRPDPDPIALGPERGFPTGSTGSSCCEIAGDSGAGDGAADPSGDGSAPLRIAAGRCPPTKLRQFQPEYPELARLARVSGTVVLDCLVEAGGSLTEVRVLSGHPLLTPAAVAAVKQWRYAPTLLNGVPVPVLLTVTVRFDLTAERP